MFQGYLVTSSVTGRLEPHYPDWRRNVFRYCVSWPVVVSCLCVVFVVMWGIFEMQVLDICRGGRKWLYPALENRLIARGRSSSLKLALIY